jgi:hypothetical protein
VDTPCSVTGKQQDCHNLQCGVRCDGSQHTHAPLPDRSRCCGHGPGPERTRTRTLQRELGFRNACGVCLN